MDEEFEKGAEEDEDSEDNKICSECEAEFTGEGDRCSVCEAEEEE